MVRVISIGVLAVFLSACATTGRGDGSQASCDRACLEGFIDGYLAALVAHEPSRLPLAKNVRFTEDTVEKPVGEGLWKTASGVRSYRQDFLDVRAGVAGALAVVEEGGNPVLLALRLKHIDRLIAEIETMVVRNAKEGAFFEVDALKTASAAMLVVPPEGQRESRENAIRIAERYPAGLKVGSFVTADAQFGDGAYRFENGRRMAGPGCTFMPPSCEDIRGQRIPTLADITHRLVAVDEELGLVWFRLDFGPGSVIGGRDRSLTAWEAFKVYDGKIHAVEAFMKIMPAGHPSGWQ